MPLVKCRECEKDVSSEAKACPNCGIDSPGGSLAATAPAKQDGFDLGRTLALLLMVGGLAGTVFFYGFFDTSVAVPTTTFMGQSFGGGRVNNIGLMQERQNGIIFGLGAFGVGAILTLLRQNKKA